MGRPNPRRANGHRRTQLRQRHIAAATHCTWEHCPWPDEPFDKALHHMDDKAIVIDEIVPVSQGGDPLSWANTRPLHRWCNLKRGDGTRTPSRVQAQPPQQPATSRTW